MKILIACEESQVVCSKFRKLGHKSYNCDTLYSKGINTDWFIHDNVLNHLDEGWDMMIAFPPCTDLAVSGARWFKEKQKDGRQQKSIEFFMKLVNADIPKIAIENPVGIMSTYYREPDQIIQPYQFGDDASKKTCLWLKNLPLLKPTIFIEPILSKTGKKIWSNQTPSGQNKLGPSLDRAKLRSKTYPGIAKAMAEQWGGEL